MTFFKLQHQLSYGTTFISLFLHVIYTNTSTYNCPKMFLLHYLERVLQILVWKATEVAIRVLNGPGSPHLIPLPTNFSNKSHLKLSRFLQQLKHFSHSLVLFPCSFWQERWPCWSSHLEARQPVLPMSICRAAEIRQTKGEADYCAEGKSGVLGVSENVQGVPLFLNRQCCFGRSMEPFSSLLSEAWESRPNENKEHLWAKSDVGREVEWTF